MGRQMLRQALPPAVALVVLATAWKAWQPATAGARPLTGPTFTVNSPADVVASAPLDNGVCETAPGNGVCTLRAAIMKANHWAGGGATIQFGLPGAVTYTLTIPPSGSDDETTGDLNINASMILSGNGEGNTIIDGSVIKDHVFRINALLVAISKVTIRSGGILNDGMLSLSNSTVSGAGIGNDGTLTINNSTISGSSGGFGGGILNISGTVTLNNSAVISNSAGYGGGIDNDNTAGTLTLINSTVSGNSALMDGGGIYNHGTTGLFNVTLSNNQADADFNGSGTGGGVYNQSGATLNFQNSILAKNFETQFFTMCNCYLRVSGDCAGTLNSNGNNILYGNDCTINGPVTFADPKLGPLANNGGPTQTHALLAGSPAIDAGNSGGCRDNLGVLLTTDQRGYLRVGRCDIGAYEVVLRGFLPLIRR